MIDRRYQVTFRRTELRELLCKAWVRCFRCEEEQLPEWFAPGLEFARPFLGFGIVEPLELRVDGPQMTSISPGSGKTLTEHFHTTCEPQREDYVRGLLEEICYPLVRIHARNRVHGALTPFNLCTDEHKFLKLWSVPTARLELSYGKTDAVWETPFRSPRVQEGETPTPADDLYSLGKLFVRLLCGDEESFLDWERDHSRDLLCSQESQELVARCLHPDPARQFSSVKELAMALKEETRIGELDFLASQERKALALGAFKEQRFEESLEHWQDACRSDWLDLSIHNNAGVTKASLKKWDEATDDLEKAYKIYQHHPLVDTNIGLCHHNMNDLAASDFWLRRACMLNPNFSQPRRVLAQFALRDGAKKKALEHALQALHANPGCRGSRLLAAEALSSLGQITEAESHRAYASRLREGPELLDHLITDQTPPPWTLYLQGQDCTVLQRMSRVDWPKLPAEDFWRWLFEGGDLGF